MASKRSAYISARYTCYYEPSEHITERFLTEKEEDASGGRARVFF